MASKVNFNLTATKVRTAPHFEQTLEMRTSHFIAANIAVAQIAVRKFGLKYVCLFVFLDFASEQQQ